MLNCWCVTWPVGFKWLMHNMFRMLIHPSSGACDLFVELFRGLYCSGSMCVGVTLWFGCGGVVSVCTPTFHMNRPVVLQPAYTRTILGEQYKSFSSSLCNLHHFPVTSSLLGPNILLNTLFCSQTPSASFPPAVSTTKFHTHTKQQTKITVLYILIWPASWSSGQSLWLLIMRSRVRFPVLAWEIFPEGGGFPAVTMVWVG